jgi:hypothetical protein
MKQFKVPLRNMFDIITTCILLYNLCIVNNKMIEDKRIVKEKNILARRLNKEEIWKDIELREKITEIFENIYQCLNF